ncbi:uncharacterized protein LOC113287770 isoform X1 [Papaver somniferum]|uniref:uncharacterized protein LOC113287770 isoform X1 n=1 Tax=Papaver somniferum TaxID=3469 RepID=UPI000E6F99EF|nr:uncharacterized protein LOC113287770 isoform X1 [Papaver somniferum]
MDHQFMFVCCLLTNLSNPCNHQLTSHHPASILAINSSSRRNTQTSAIAVTNTTTTTTTTPYFYFCFSPQSQALIAEWLHTDSKRTIVGVDMDLEKLEWSLRNNVDSNGFFNVLHAELYQ